MSNLYIKIIAVFLLLPHSLMAHTGYDHSPFFDLLIHLAWITPTVLLFVFVSYKIKMRNLAKEGR